MFRVGFVEKVSKRRGRNFFEGGLSVILLLLPTVDSRTFQLIQVIGTDLFKGAALGITLQEGPKQVAGLVSKALKFRSTHRNLGFAMQRAIPVVQEMKRLNQGLELPEVETAGWLEDLQEVENIFNAHSNVPW
ncbi:hypothetical protein GYH30_012033 [Glycine max]|nr:hypothetical protein GYH30_012033 [Glycine max]